MRLVWTLFAHAAGCWLSRLIVLAGAIFLIGTSLEAAVLEATTTPPPAPTPPGAKFLFIVETSAAMTKFEHSGRQVVFDLIYGGISNQMQKADSFGIWTFSEQVSAGAYPMQMWSPERSLELASQAGVFLKTARYKGKPQLEVAIAQALSLVKLVKDVNGVIVTSGEAPLGLTELEVRVRDLYRQKAEQARQKGLPLVLAFSSAGGEIAAAGITLAGEKIPMREDLLAKAREPVKKPEPAADLAKLAAPATNHARPKPIIMIGQPKTTPPVPTTSVAPVVEASGNQTNQALAAVPNESRTKPATANPLVGEVSAPPPPAAVEATKPALAKAMVPPPTHPETPAPKATPSATALASGTSAGTANPPEGGNKTTGTETAVTKVLGEIASTPALKVAAREPMIPRSETPPAVIAASVPPRTGLDSRGIMLLGAGFFAAALGLCAWVFYKLRMARETTFISRSMSRKQSGPY